MYGTTPGIWEWHCDKCGKGLSKDEDEMVLRFADPDTYGYPKGYSSVANTFHDRCMPDRNGSAYETSVSDTNLIDFLDTLAHMMEKNWVSDEQIHSLIRKFQNGHTFPLEATEPAE